MFKQLVGVDGRVNRLGYLARAVLTWVIAGIAIGLITVGSIAAVIGVILYITAIVIGFCTTVRRLHDFGWGGGRILLVLVPLLNLVIWVMLFFRPGESESNNHGDQPNGVMVGLG